MLAYIQSDLASSPYKIIYRRIRTSATAIVGRGFTVAQYDIVAS